MKYESGQTSDQTETIPEISTNDCRRLRDKVHYEQFLDQTDGYRLSMLTIDGSLEDDDDPDEDAEMEESWVPKFRR
jgi:hypothetical protein